jgi:uncharacterized membrane protein
MLLAGRTLKQYPDPQSRLVAVDVARVLAIMLMIQGHSFDVLLAPQFRQGTLFNQWLFLRGFTAPMFLVLAGISFSISTVRRWDRYTQASHQVARRVARFSLFTLLGYSMHLPRGTFRDLLSLDAASWQSGLQVDVLQCIGITLVVLQLLVMIVRTPARLARVAAGLSASVALVTPIVWNVHWTSHLPVFFAAYLDGNTGSLFPLFPWAGYIFLGAAAGYAYLRTPALLFSRTLFASSAAAICLSLLLSKLPLSIYKHIDIWRTSPALFLGRAGCVCLLVAVIDFITRTTSIPDHRVRFLAQESLSIYFIHVCILYGTAWNLGLRQLIGSTLSPLPALAWMGLLMSAMVVLAWTWNGFKRFAPRSMLLAWARTAS